MLLGKGDFLSDSVIWKYCDMSGEKGEISVLYSQVVLGVPAYLLNFPRVVSSTLGKKESK